MKLKISLPIPILLIYFSYHYKRYKMVKSIDKMLMTGTIPLQLDSCKREVKRPELVDSIRKRFIGEEKVQNFGVILGPTGTGKTHATIEVCRTKPTSGVLYTAICDPSTLSWNLARTIGMKVEPANFSDRLFDIFFFFTRKPSTYYSLPDKLSEGMGFVLETLAKRAIKFKETNGTVPVLFIDGVDILARKSPDDFADLVSYARFHANCGQLKIVMVSSEGHIMPLITEKTSSKIQADVFEVRDLDNETASKYFADIILNDDEQGKEASTEANEAASRCFADIILKDYEEGKKASTKAKSHQVTAKDGMKAARAERLAKRITSRIGGRFVYLNSAFRYMKDILETDPKITEDDLVNQVIDRSVEDVVGRREFHIGTTERIILMHLFQHNGFFRLEDLQLVRKQDDEFKIKLSCAIDNLVKNNLLRYNVSGGLCWHSKLVEDKLRQCGYGQ